jgi:hypothetical protein
LEVGLPACMTALPDRRTLTKGNNEGWRWRRRQQQDEQGACPALPTALNSLQFCLSTLTLPSSCLAADLTSFFFSLLFFFFVSVVSFAAIVVQEHGEEVVQHQGQVP